MPECAFLVPVDDVFHSCVTRDPFPDPRAARLRLPLPARASRASAKLARMADVLRVGRGTSARSSRRGARSPRPRSATASVAEVDRCLAGGQLAVTGNYFAGLAIEDCVLRSNAEWARISG